MVNFEFLENLAIEIKENRTKLYDVEDALSNVKIKLHEIPLKRTTESTFARMIGVGYNDKISELEKAKEQLERTMTDLKATIAKDTDTFISEISSPQLIIPLEENPMIVEGKTIYKYRAGAQFKNLFDILCEILGRSSPLVVKDVMLSPTEITIAVKDEFEAKQKFINSFMEVQNTLLIKKR